MRPLHLSAKKASAFVQPSAVARIQRGPVRRPISPVRVAVQPIEAKRICQLSGAKRNKANNVSFSNKKSRKFQQVNLQEKEIYFEGGKRWVKLKVSVKTLRTIQKKGIESVAAKAGVDLYSLKYRDVSPARLAFKATNPRPPMPKNPRRIKNPEKIAASKKKPLVKEYCVGKVIMVRSDE